MSSDLKSLRDIIFSSINDILLICESSGKDFPSLNDPIQPSEFSPDGIRNDAVVAESIRHAVAAATQLIATLQPPPVTMTISAFKFTLPAALGVAEAGNVAEILRSAGPKGMHVGEIAVKSGMDPKKLSRVLRYLATNHWFREVAPDIFAQNLLSSLMDSGKDITAGFAEGKHDNSLGMSALAGFAADDAIKAGSFLVEAMTDPKSKYSDEPSMSASTRALGIEGPLWEYYDTPEGQYRRKRFATVMASFNKIQPPESILSSYDWSSVPEGGLVVDVGGGLGHVTLEIAKVFHSLHVVVEDRPPLVEQAKQFWKENLPEAVSGGRAHFIELPGSPDVFLLRQISHDWSDSYLTKLLHRLRDAASPTTKLIIIDSVLDYACSVNGEKAPPPPLLPNMGGANLLTYVVDVTVFGMLNAGERTPGGFEEVLSASGWQFKEIRRNPNNPLWWPSVISVPK